MGLQNLNKMSKGKDYSGRMNIAALLIAATALLLYGSYLLLNHKAEGLLIVFFAFGPLLLTKEIWYKAKWTT